MINDTQNNIPYSPSLDLTDNSDLVYLLLQERGDLGMQGAIRVKGKCPDCGNSFKQIDRLGFICPACKVKPTRFFIDLRYKRLRLRLFSDKQGQALDTYQRARNLLEHINYEIKDFCFNPNNYIKAEIEKYWVVNLVDKFLMHKLDSIAPSYQKDYLRLTKFAKDFFKTKDAREIRKIDLVNYKDHLEQTTSLCSKSIKNVLDVFRVFLRWLKNDLEIINNVPAFPIIETRESSWLWLSADDQIKLLELIPIEHRPIITFLMLHGCRPGEARALKCKDVNPKNESITISATFSNGFYRARRKGRGARPVMIPIHPEMFDFLTERVKNNLPEAYIFINPMTGSYYKETYLKLVWQKVRAKAGLNKKLRLYDATRHSFASQLVNSNVPLYTVSKLLGHTSIKTTEKYAHANIENLKANIKKLSLIDKTVTIFRAPDGHQRQKQQEISQENQAVNE